MVKISYLTVACGMLLLGACGQSDGISNEDSRANGTSMDVASVEPSVVQHTSPAPRRGTLLKQDAGDGATDDVDLANGQRRFGACRGCHLINDSGRNTTGPNLYGLFDRQAGSIEGFNYSPAFQEADFVWTAESLDEFLAAPRTFMPGNRMPFGGMRNPGHRADLIAWLVAETASATDEAGE